MHWNLESCVLRNWRHTVLLALISLFYLAPPCLAQEEEPRSDETTPPVLEACEIVSGYVVDAKGRPIAGATVKTQVFSHSEDGAESAFLAKEILTTNESGWFVLEILKEPATDHKVTLAAFVSCKNCFETQFTQSGLESSGKLLELDPFVLTTTGTHIRGRIVSPNMEDDAPTGAIVSISGNYKSADGSTEYINQNLQCDSEGSFTGVVPATCKIKLQIMAPNYASNSFSFDIKPEEPLDADEPLNAKQKPARDLGELELKNGTSVFGTAKLLDGRPAVGVVLAMIQGDDVVAPSDISAAKTDAKGRFRFHPHTGKCTIVAVKSCLTRGMTDGTRQSLKSNGDVPLIGPHFLDLDGQSEDLEVDLTESESITLSGVVRNKEGNPVPGVTVRCGWHTDRGLIEVEFLRTNKRGEYSSRIPTGSVPSLKIRNQWVFQKMYESFLADPMADSSHELFINPEAEKNERLKFKPTHKSVSDLDWVMVRHRRKPTPLQRVGGAMKWLFWAE